MIQQSKQNGKLAPYVQNSDVPDIELSILSACISKHAGEARDIILSELNTYDFSISEHKQIFELIVYCIVNEELPTRYRLYELVTEKKLPNTIIKTINSLDPFQGYNMGAGYIKSLCRDLKAQSTRYRLFQLGVDLIERAGHQNGTTPTQLVNDTFEKVSDFVTNKSLRPDTLHDIVEHVEAEQNYFRQAGWYERVKTGFRALDNRLNILPGRLIILGGWTSHGKSAFALNVANNLIKNNVPVLYTSIEMSRADVLYRMACMNDPKSSLEFYTTGHVQNLQNAPGLRIIAPFMEHFNMFDLDTASEIEISMMIQRHVMTVPTTGLVIIDYLQAVRCDRFPNQSTHRQFSSMAYFFRGLAKRLNIPIMLLTQLRRDEQKMGVTRRLSNKYDLKESGDIENAADAIMLINRLFEEEQTDNWNCVLNLDKQRQGKRGLFGLRFIGKNMIFEEALLPTNQLEPYRIKPEWVLPENIYGNKT